MTVSRYGVRRSVWLIVAAGAVVVAGVLVFLTGHRRASNTIGSGSALAAAAASGSVPPVGYRPPVVAVPSSPRQSSIDSQLAQAEQPATPPPGLLGSLPPAGYSPAYSPVSVQARQDRVAFGLAFVSELLDRRYTGQSRPALLAWAQAEAAANTLPGVPSSWADRALVLSLADPAANPGPVPSQSLWDQAAGDGRAQTVTDLQAVTDPEWLALTATGWQPSDPDMTILMITGSLVTSGPGGGSSVSFSLDLTLGSALSHPGLGAVAVDDWAVG